MFEFKVTVHYDIWQNASSRNPLTRVKCTCKSILMFQMFKKRSTHQVVGVDKMEIDDVKMAKLAIRLLKNVSGQGNNWRNQLGG